MAVGYFTQYTDEFGTETTTIVNDGKIMSMTLREVEFAGYNFHAFRISSVADSSKRKLFNLFVDELCGYSIDCQIPIWLVSKNEELQTLLRAHIEYGKPLEDHSAFGRQDRTNLGVSQYIDLEILKLEISYQGQTYESGGKKSYSTFDEQLAELRDSLPADVYLKTCWNCAFSDYLPSGSGYFGNLGCFRNVKNEYKQVKDKRALMLLWKNRAEDVQEIQLCPEFEKRHLGIGGLYVG